MRPLLLVSLAVLALVPTATAGTVTVVRDEADRIAHVDVELGPPDRKHVAYRVDAEPDSDLRAAPARLVEELPLFGAVVAGPIRASSTSASPASRRRSRRAATPTCSRSRRGTGSPRTRSRRASSPAPAMPSRARSRRPTAARRSRSRRPVTPRRPLPDEPVAGPALRWDWETGTTFELDSLEVIEGAVSPVALEALRTTLPFRVHLVGPFAGTGGEPDAVVHQLAPEPSAAGAGVALVGALAALGRAHRRRA